MELQEVSLLEVRGEAEGGQKLNDCGRGRSLTYAKGGVPSSFFSTGPREPRSSFPIRGLYRNSIGSLLNYIGIL